jgi:hypothetical protein
MVVGVLLAKHCAQFTPAKLIAEYKFVNVVQYLAYTVAKLSTLVIPAAAQVSPGCVRVRKAAEIEFWSDTYCVLTKVLKEVKRLQ